MRAIFLATLLVGAVPMAASAAPADVKASVAATAARSEANLKLDGSRKPAFEVFRKAAREGRP